MCIFLDPTALPIDLRQTQADSGVLLDDNTQLGSHSSKIYATMLELQKSSVSDYSAMDDDCDEVEWLEFEDDISEPCNTASDSIIIQPQKEHFHRLALEVGQQR
ncbi:uncharacterized protein LOC129807680 [Phlebotomus papatasi]|uniref:uncharacterized protein LOC129807680 n=1 Tax=Phlebotomus papatasi TaxID=29031 RepID=UPI00248340AF|nr:uncharacterized protein LOC129807680 [Phlebotomus papatasi]